MVVPAIRKQHAGEVEHLIPSVIRSPLVLMDTHPLQPIKLPVRHNSEEGQD